MIVIGEYGGIGKRTEGHMWDAAGAISIQDPSKYSDPQVFWNTYDVMLRKIAGNIQRGLSAAIYTQLTDVEQEVMQNLMTSFVDLNDTLMTCSSRQVSAIPFAWHNCALL